MATQALLDARRGSGQASARLMALVYEQLHDMAARFLREEPCHHTLGATALVHEAYLRLIEQDRVEWRDRTHFFAVAAEAMRRILVDHARRRRAAKRGGGWQKVTLHEAVAFSDACDVELLALEDALTRLTTLDQRQGRVVELRFFGGLTVDEVAGVLGVSKRTVEGDWRMARAWLHQEITKP